MLTALIAIPLIAGILAAFAGEGRGPRLIALAALGADTAIALWFWFAAPAPFAVAGQGAWLAYESLAWIPRNPLSARPA